MISGGALGNQVPSFEFRIGLHWFLPPVPDGSASLVGCRQGETARDGVYAAPRPPTREDTLRRRALVVSASAGTFSTDGQEAFHGGLRFVPSQGWGETNSKLVRRAVCP